MLEIAKQAKEQFNLAQENYATLPDEPHYSHMAGDTPAILGEVNLNILVVELFFATKSFRSKDAQAKLVKYLKDPDQKHLQEIMQLKNLQKSNFSRLIKDNSTFLKELYPRTKDRLTAATRKMALSNIRMDILERNADDFNKYFGHDVLKTEWEKIADSKTTATGEKIKALEGLLLPVLINNFTWTVAKQRKFLTQWIKILEKIETLDGNLSDHSALCYVTIYMAAIFNQDKSNPLKRATSITLIGRRVSEIIGKPHHIHTEIVDLCNFYLMLHWPTGDDDDDLDDSDLFFKCLNLLKKRQAEFSDDWFRLSASNQGATPKSKTRQLQVLFHVLEKQTKDESRMGSLKDAEVKRGYVFCRGAKKYEGRLRGSEVIFQAKGNSSSIHLRKDKSDTIKGNLVDVTFNVVFTVIGPVACNIEERL